MTIDEAIQHCENVAHNNDITKQRYDDASGYTRSGREEIRTSEAKKCEQCAADHRQLAGWLKELKQLREQTRWIPCSERLPEEDGQYLITVKYKPEADYEDIYAEHGEWTNGQWDMFCFGHCGKVEDIIAWMPLPEPYKAETEREKKI